jgi:hypothetical protein
MDVWYTKEYEGPKRDMVRILPTSGVLTRSPLISALHAEAAFYGTDQKTNLKAKLNVLNAIVCARWDR